MPENPTEIGRQNTFSPERLLQLPPRDMTDLLESLSRKQLESLLEKIVEHPALIAHISYWEKWLQTEQRRLVDELVVEKKRIYEPEKADEGSLPLHLEERFTPDELSLIFSAIGAIQLTFGCSKGCPFCAFDALPGIREHIPYTQLANLFQQYGKNLKNSKPFLYWASEPIDYASEVGLENKTYQDVHQLAVEYAGYVPHVTHLRKIYAERVKFFD